MLMLTPFANVIPKSLFIYDVKTETHLGATMISMGGFGRVFKGEYKGQLIALKVVDKGHHDVSVSSSFLFRQLIHLVRIRSEKTSAGRP